MTDPDRKLAERAGRGDRRALVELYERHRSRLLGYLIKLVGKRDAAEDVFQEVWIKVLRGIGNYQAGSRPFRAWLYRIASNAAVDRLRRNSKHAGEELDAPAGEDRSLRVDLLETNTPGPERMSESAEAGRGLARALSSLGLRQKTAVLLRHQQGLTYSEIAEVLQVPEGTAKTLVHRGVMVLRGELERYSGV